MRVAKRGTEVNLQVKTEVMRVTQSIKQQANRLSKHFGTTEAEVLEGALSSYELTITGSVYSVLPELQLTASALDISLVRLAHQMEMLEELAQELTLDQFKPEEA